MRKGAVFSFALLLASLQQGAAQDIVSASAGVLHYFEGVVTIDNKPIEHKAAVFPSLKNGSIIHTEKGRAELLLTPGVYLRMDEDTSLRMVSNSLSDARLEMTDGSVILDNLNAPAQSPVTLIYSENQVQFLQGGIYRIDRFTGELQVFSGEAKVTRHGASSSTTIDPSHLYYFALDLTMSKLGDGLTDEFYDWARNRSDLLADQVQMAAAEQEDAQNPDPNALGSSSLGMPPVMPTPGYTPPANPLYGYAGPGYYGDPYASNPLTSAYFGLPTIFLITPGRYRTGLSKWPVLTGITNRPLPIVTRWPHPAAMTGFSAIGGSYSTRSPYAVGTSMNRAPYSVSAPRAATTPRVGTPAAAPRVAAPHVGFVGHR